MTRGPRRRRDTGGESAAAKTGAPAGIRPESTGSIAASDLFVVATLPLLAVVARAVPESRWPGTLRSLARFKPPAAATERARVARMIEALDIEQAAARRIAADFRTAHLEERLQILKERSSAGFHPEIALEGEERLHAALDRERGAVLWVTNAVLAGLIVKKALHARGYRLHHLSRPAHGFSTTRFGIRWLNPLRTGVEERYLAERVSITDATTVTAMRRLRRALDRGEPVSITVGDWGRRTRSVPFLGSHLRLATGPASLAAGAGAPLLPVFMSRVGRAFTVSIEEPLPMAQARADGGDEAGTTAALETYARRLEPWVRVNPQLWNGWDSLE